MPDTNKGALCMKSAWLGVLEVLMLMKAVESVTYPSTKGQVCWLFMCRYGIMACIDQDAIALIVIFRR